MYVQYNFGVLDPATQTFTIIEISNKISSLTDDKYWEGVLALNNKVHFIPYTTDIIGELKLDNVYPAYEVEGGVPEAWRSLLFPHFNKF